MSIHRNLLGEGVPPTLLPDDPAVEVLTGEAHPADAAARFPASSLAWAVLAESALALGSPGDDVAAYAYARTGYHRGLDALRANGWRGQGPVPWEHLPNQGFLRAVSALAEAAERIGESAEVQRCRQLLLDCSPTAYEQLGARG